MQSWGHGHGSPFRRSCGKSTARRRFTLRTLSSRGTGIRSPKKRRTRAEGFAQAAVNVMQEDGDKLFPPSLFTQVEPTSSAASRPNILLQSLTPPDQVVTRPKQGPYPRVHRSRASSPVDCVWSHVGDKLPDITAQWASELEGDNVPAAAIEKKIQELPLLTALVYGVGGWAGRERSQNGEFNADFFIMHMITSSIFLPSFVAYLSPHSAALLLRGHFTVALTWYIGRDRPALSIREG
ncbi:hypothetical protein GSI_03172 [Ganoderma sinense ZZ0214-1]|uniref:Uncharacterized protein n=1 Tax=Ganoderma sinense ZZ0214-1 TaxID=1077348 RepID=A0A2G8SKW4_9APHY|nr:hypothetical protein GSI_03172 [Ganoderma sinense ZZ0214-1]